MPSKTVAYSMIVIASALVLGACTLGKAPTAPADDQQMMQEAPGANGETGQVPPAGGTGADLNGGGTDSGTGTGTTDIYNAPTQPAGAVPGI